MLAAYMDQFNTEQPYNNRHSLQTSKLDHGASSPQALILKSLSLDNPPEMNKTRTCK